MPRLDIAALFSRALLLIGLAALILLPGCAAVNPAPQACIGDLAPAGYQAPKALVDGEVVALEALLDRARGARVLLLGERHDRWEHHLNQAEVVCRLVRRGVPLAIGLEAFQLPFQASLDAYVAGEQDLRGLLESSEYYARWRFDHRLYQPIFELAARHRIPLVALNAPSELTRRIAEAGFRALTEDERGAFPFGVREPDAAYRRRVEKLFASHPDSASRDPERFVRVQWTWDEVMGQQAAHYLARHPQRVMAVIAGDGHVAPPDAIARRVQRAGAVGVARILQPASGPKPPPAGEVVVLDARLMGSEVELPPSGRLGVFLEAERGAVRVTSLAEPSAAGAAGVKPGDRLHAINGQAVGSYTDVKLALAGQPPGTVAALEIGREGRRTTVEVTLQ